MRYARPYDVLLPKVSKNANDTRFVPCRPSLLLDAVVEAANAKSYAVDVRPAARRNKEEGVLTKPVLVRQVGAPSSLVPARPVSTSLTCLAVLGFWPIRHRLSPIRQGLLAKRKAPIFAAQVRPRLTNNIFLPSNGRRHVP